MASSKVAVVTGTSRGIGLELTRQLCAKGWTVYPTCRTLTEELNSVNLNGGEVISNVDVSTDEGIGQLATKVLGKKLDLLINNAGILIESSLEALDVENIRKQFEVNALAPLKVTAALRRNLSEGSKIIFITSRMGSIGDNSGGSHYGYRMSKAALNMASMSLSRDLAPAKIIVQTIHPGMVSTDMTSKYGGGISPTESVTGILQRIEEASMETTGKFYHANGQELPW